MHWKSLSARSRIRCPSNCAGLLQKTAGTVVLVLSSHSTSHLILQSQASVLPRRSLPRMAPSHPQHPQECHPLPSSVSWGSLPGMAPSHPQHTAPCPRPSPLDVTLSPARCPRGSPVLWQPHRSLRMSSGLKRSRGSVCRLLLAKDLGDKKGCGGDTSLAAVKGQGHPRRVPQVLTGASGT